MTSPRKNLLPGIMRIELDTALKAIPQTCFVEMYYFVIDSH